MPDDLMELSSDLNRPSGTNDDIEIDLDLTGDQGQETDNDYMIEDDKSEAQADNNLEAPPSVKDDLMLDDDAVSQTMQDDAPVLDEEPYDVDIIEHDESNTTITGPNGEGLSQDTATDLPGTGYSEYEQEDELIDHSVHEVEEPAELLDVDFENPREEEVDPPQERELEAQSKETIVSHYKKETQAVNVGQEQSSVSTDPTPQNQTLSLDNTLNTTNDCDEEAHNEPSHDLDTSNADYSHQEVANEVLAVHPVVLVYQGREMSLFPSSNQGSDIYFLQDETLAHQSVSDLLQACRSILGDDVAEGEELTIAMAELGLYINEDSSHASTISLSQILDVHVQLLQQDGVDSPDPLYMTLSTKDRFTKRFSELTAAIAEGRGMTHVRTWDVQGEEDYDTEEQPLDDGDGELNEVEGDHDLAGVENAGEESREDQTEPKNSIDKEHHSDDAVLSIPATEPTIAYVGVNEDSKDQHGGLETKSPEASDDLQNADNANRIATDSAPDEAPSSKANNTESFEANQQHATYVGEDTIGEFDLIDYSDEEQEVEKNPSTGTSTLQGDDGTVTNGISEDFIETCYRPGLCFCSPCNDLTDGNLAVASNTDQPTQTASVPDGNDNTSPIEQPLSMTEGQSTDANNAEPHDHGSNLNNEHHDEGDEGELYPHHEDFAGEDLDDPEPENETWEPDETANDSTEPEDDEVGDEGAEERQLENPSITGSAHDGNHSNGNNLSEHVTFTADAALHNHDAQDEEINGEHSLSNGHLALDQTNTGLDVPGPSARNLSDTKSVGESTNGHTSKHDQVDFLDDDELINFDEEEDEVATPNQKSDHDLDTTLAKPNGEVSSSKRPRDQGPGLDEKDDGSKDPKRVRSR